MIEDIALTGDQDAIAVTAARSFAGCQGLAPQDIAARIASDGLLSIMADTAAGGLGLGAGAAWPIARAAGAALLPYPMAEAMAAAWVAPTVYGLIDGSLVGTIGFSSNDLTHDRQHQCKLSGVAANVVFALLADRILIVGNDGVFVVSSDAPAIEIVSSQALDLERPYGDIVLADTPAVRVGDTGRLIHLCGILRAADMLGAAEAAFAAACAHAGNRRQFGKPLSGQQVLAADLARDYFRLECVQTSIAYAALCWDEQSAEAADAHDVAVATAAEMLPVVIESAIQVHGAMGFTWEMPLHRWLRRVRAAVPATPATMLRQNLAARRIADWAEAA